MHRSCSIRFFVPAALALTAAGAGLRLLDLSADPPSDMHAHFISDEGWWARNARQHAVFGRWVMDEFNPGFYAAPVWTGLVRGSYELLGVGLWQTRVVPALAGVLTLGCIGLVLARHVGRGAALAGMAIWAFDYFVVTNNRVAFVETVPAMLMAVALLLCTAHKYHLLAGVGAGAAVVVAVFAKVNTVFFLPVLPLASLIQLWLQRRDDGVGAGARGAPLRAIAGYLLGAAACGVVWWVAFVGPHRPEISAQMAIHASENNPGLSWHLLSRPWSFGLRETDHRLGYGGFLAQSLLTLVPSCVWLIYRAAGIQQRGWRRELGRLNRVEIAACCWIVCMVLPLVVAKHGWDRRYYNLTVPLTLLGACALSGRRDPSPAEFPEPMEADLPRRQRLLAALLVTVPFVLYLRVPVANALLPLTDRIRIGSQPGISAGACCALAVGLILSACLPLSRVALKRIHASAAMPAMLVVGACILSLGLQGTRYWRAAASRSHSIRAASEQLASVLPPDARVAGGLADSLLIGTGIQTFPLLNRSHGGPGIVNRDQVAVIRPTHCLLDGKVDDQRLAAAVRDYLGAAALPAPESIHRVGLWRDREGQPRFGVTLCQVTIAETDLLTARHGGDGQ